jgi:hypothetical protein
MATKINVRSPFFIKSTPSVGSLVRAKMQLYVYTGTLLTDKPTSAQYTITKAPISGNNYVVFEISELVRDYLDVNFNQERTEDAYIERVEADGGVIETSPCLTNFSLEYDADYSSGTSWVEADIEVTYNYTSGEVTETQSFDYIAFDGYSYFEEGANSELSRTLLQSNTDIYYQQGQTLQVPIFSEDVTSVKFYYNGSLHTTRLISESDNSNAQISYPSVTSDTDKIEIISGSGTETITVYPTSECKFTPYRVTFVNKFGALQNIYFFKKSTESIDVKEEVFKASVMNDFDLRYDLQSHQYKSFHKSGRERITMNTGFVSEEYNKVIKELMLSEQVWIRKNSEILPINVRSKSLTYKTSVNDKLINYTIEFDYSFDKINNVR